MRGPDIPIAALVDGATADKKVPLIFNKEMFFFCFLFMSIFIFYQMILLIVLPI
jgi:hypothetical protein